MHGVPGNWEDTREFLVKPAPAVARSMREGMHIKVQARIAENPVPDFDAPREDTKEIVLMDGKGSKRTLSDNEQLAEMVRIIFVLNRLEGKLSEFLPCGAGAGEGLEKALKEAARKASLVEAGRSPKQEFLSQIPAPLLPPVLGFYDRAGAMEV